MTSDVAVVILAGGEGSRIGGNKPLRILGRERLIDRALRQARGWSGLVAIAVRTWAQVQPVDALLLVDDPDVEGPLGALVTALKFAKDQRREFVLTIPADMPFLPPDLLKRTAAALGQAGCALADSGGYLHPVCGLWRTSVLNEVEAYLRGRRRSLKGLAEWVGFVAVEWPDRPRNPFFNINSEDDLSRAEQML